MESLADLKDMLNQNDYMIKLDLTDAYHSVPLNLQSSAKFVRFIWRDKIYECQTLMFGLGPAPRIFTKLLKVPISTLRKLLIRIVIYIDDMIIMAKSPDEAIEARDTTIYLLETLGFRINYKKSILLPSQELQFLGVTVNSKTMTFSIPKEKLQKLKQTCRETLNSSKLSVRDLTQVMGRLRATAIAFSPAPLQLRSIQNLVKVSLRRGNNSYQTNLKLNKESRQELQWWLQNLNNHNGKPMSLAPPDLI